MTLLTITFKDVIITSVIIAYVIMMITIALSSKSIIDDWNEDEMQANWMRGFDDELTISTTVDTSDINIIPFEDYNFDNVLPTDYYDAKSNEELREDFDADIPVVKAIVNGQKKSNAKKLAKTNQIRRNK